MLALPPKDFSSFDAIAPNHRSPGSLCGWSSHIYEWSVSCLGRTSAWMHAARPLEAQCWATPVHRLWHGQPLDEWMVCLLNTCSPDSSSLIHMAFPSRCTILSRPDINWISLTYRDCRRFRADCRPSTDTQKHPGHGLSRLSLPVWNPTFDRPL